MAAIVPSWTAIEGAMVMKSEASCFMKSRMPPGFLREPLTKPSAFAAFLVGAQRADRPILPWPGSFFRMRRRAPFRRARLFLALALAGRRRFEALALALAGRRRFEALALAGRRRFEALALALSLVRRFLALALALTLAGRRRFGALALALAERRELFFFM